MRKEFKTIKSVMGNMRPVRETIKAGIMIVLFAFSGESSAASEPVYQEQSTASQKATKEMCIPLEDGTVSLKIADVSSPTREKMSAAYGKLRIPPTDRSGYDLLLRKMTAAFERIPVINVTADIDEEEKSLEMVLLLNPNVMVSVEKSYDTISDNSALATFVHQHEIMYCGLMTMEKLSDCAITLCDRFQTV